MTSDKVIGSKAQVWHGTCTHTPGGITKRGLLKKKDGRIVFAAKSRAAKKGKGFRALKKGGHVVKKGVNPFA